jgi:2-polyprenyl-3-methyl-5-hydroxy-6-metoxy-1,4-benzoquinol methylase
LDVGCGNGALCKALAQAGFEVSGCDPSIEGIQHARRAHPEIDFHVLAVEHSPGTRFGGAFDAVVSTEVIEHLYQPRLLPRFAAAVLRDRGHLIVSTPYHGYAKNLALSVADRWDQHLSPFWDGGHIKFWSRATLTQLISEEGFDVTHFIGVGRIAYLWKSMIVAGQKRELMSRA